MLIIRHLTGPLADKEERIDPSLDRVAFGRKIGCQIVYPPEETTVAREHFALVRRPPGSTGHWTIDLFGEPFVAVNGIEADPGQPLPAEATFELGKLGGPSFKVLVQPDAAPDNLPRTGSQQEHERPRLLARQAGMAARYARQLAMLGAAIAVVAVAAGGYYAYEESQLRIGADVRERLVRAVYSVRDSNGNPHGTAWPVAPRVLATNAHVAADIEKLKPGETMLVRSPGANGRMYQVVKYQVHPAYGAFGAVLAEFRQDAPRQMFYQLGVLGYDVALLQINEDVPADSILELASAEELRTVASGAVVAMAGYPGELVAGRALGGAPELRVGTITSVTDFFFLPADFETAQLVHHDLPGTGGTSGSPIAARSGRVVALNSAATFYFTPEGGRIPSGVLINYGQRVDMLRNLISDHGEHELAQARKYWTQQLGKLSRGPDIVATWVASAIRDKLKSDIEFARVSEQTLSLSDGPVSNNGVTQRQKSQDVQVPTDSDFVISAYAHARLPIELFIYAGDKLIAQDNANQKFVRWVALKPGSNTTLTAWVVSKADREVTYTLQLHKYRPKAGT
jgi:hypothetical protein